jgi:hypothetical protein
LLVIKRAGRALAHHQTATFGTDQGTVDAVSLIQSNFSTQFVNTGTASTKPMRPGQEERREFEYKRHGTQCLIGNFEVATGAVITPTVQATRTEQDFAVHIAATVATDPQAGWIFVTDNLTIHCSESLVRYVAQECGIADHLGRKGRRGVLKSVATRKAFLTDPGHRIRYVYVPKHTSWLNQIEIWFSILVRTWQGGWAH